MTTTISHPVLRGRVEAAPTRRRASMVGVNTSRFWMLASVVTVLNLVGVLMTLSASSVASVKQSGTPWFFAQRQFMWTGVGVLALLVTLYVSVSFWRRFAAPLFFLSLVPLVAVLVPGLGATKNGAARWIAIGPLQLQPSEFVKLTLLILVADILARRSHLLDDWRETLRPVLILLGVVAALIMKQPNLGTTLIITAMVLTVVWVAGVRLLPLGVIGLAGAALAGLAVLLEPFRLRRMMSFLDLRGNLDGTGYQTGQAMVGFANGGWLGRGLGRSTVKWGYLPYAFNDFIFAVIGEEFGLFGALAVVGLFVAFVVTGTSIALAAEDRFSMLLAIGVTAWLGVQAIMNMAVVTGTMPLTGVPLPFISFGGSAQIINLAAVGLLLNVARHPADPTRRSRRRLEAVPS